MRRPHGEVHAGHAFVLDRMRAQAVVQVRVGALAQEPDVERAEHRAVRVHVVDDPLRIGVAGAQEVAREPRDRSLEKARPMALPQGPEQLAVAGRHLDLVGAGHERPHQQAAADVVHAEHRERIAMAALDDRLHGRASEGARGRRRGHRFGAGRPQTSSAYSRIVRSEEKKATFAVFWMAERHHASAVAPARVDAVLRVDVAREVRRSP